MDLFQSDVGHHYNLARTARSPGYAGSQYPSTVPDSVGVATFYTHPNPSGEGWEPAPSAADTQSAWASLKHSIRSKTFLEQMDPLA